jgi:hypothetical protein
MTPLTDAGNTAYYELGTGHVLTKLLRRMGHSAACHAIGTPDDFSLVTQ